MLNSTTPMGDRPIAPRAPELPSIFWGALGCVSVLGVGFTVLFLVARPGAGGRRRPRRRPSPPWRSRPGLRLPAHVRHRTSSRLHHPAAAPAEAVAPPPARAPKAHHPRHQGRPRARRRRPGKDDGKADTKPEDSAGDSDEAGAPHGRATKTTGGSGGKASRARGDEDRRDRGRPEAGAAGGREHGNAKPAPAEGRRRKGRGARRGRRSGACRTPPRARVRRARRRLVS